MNRDQPNPPTDPSPRLRAVPQHSLGWMPALAVVGAAGLLCVAVAYGGSRLNAPWAQALFWAGALLSAAAFLLRLNSPAAGRAERIGLLIGLNVCCYFLFALYSPVGFTSYDEFLHWRTANDVVRTGRLFAPNPLLPISPAYPGLEIATHAIVSLAGLTIEQAGQVLVVLVGQALVIALYLFYEQVGRSVRVATAATALYVINPSHIFFDAQYAYESCALPLAILVLYALARADESSPRDARRLRVCVVAAIAAVSATHHITSYFLTALLGGWTVVALAYRRRGLNARGVGWAAAVSLAANLGWLILASGVTLGYLAPHVRASLEELARIISGEAASRILFQSTTGARAPLLERLVGMGSAALTLVGVPAGLTAFWLFHRRSAAAATLAIGALAYPFALGLRFTGEGWELGSRAAAFIYVPLAFVLGLAVEQFAARLRPAPLRTLAPGALTVLLFAGGVIAGSSPSDRLPRPYVAGADSPGIEPQSIAAALWARDNLRPPARLVTDRTNALLMGAYGEQQVVTDALDRISVSPIFASPRLDSTELYLIRKGDVRYVVADTRFTREQPHRGFYYERWEQDLVPFTMPLDPRRLDKFDRAPGVDRVFDSGDIRVYDLGATADER